MERKAFLLKPKHQYLVSQWEEHDCAAQSQKEWILIWESKLVLFDGWTLIKRKMVDEKAFLAKPQQQYHLSQWEHDCSAESQKNKDYYENLSLSHLMDELRFHWKCAKKSFSWQRKHQYHVPRLGEHDHSAQSW